MQVFEWIQKGFVEDAAFTIGQNGDSAGEEPSTQVPKVRNVIKRGPQRSTGQHLCSAASLLSAES